MRIKLKTWLTGALKKFEMVRDYKLAIESQFKLYVYGCCYIGQL